MINDSLSTKVIGHVRIKEHDDYEVLQDGNIVPKDAGKIVLDKLNAVHPQNMARVISRALANESNYFVHRMAFGNGGTVVDVAQNITYRTPRDGLNPGDNGWEARLYNETYSEIIDDSNVNVGGGSGSSPGDDPTSIEHVSGPGVRSVEDLTDGSIISSVVVTVVLNPNEPSGQVSTQQGEETNTESNFTFDEIALFTSGAPAANTAGYQRVDVGGKVSNQDTGLTANTNYQFTISVDGGAGQTINVTTPVIGTGDGTNAPLDAITYGDLVTALNLPGGDLQSVNAVASITDGVPTQDGGSETYGFLQFTSISSGSTSSIALTDIDLFTNLSGFVGIELAVDGEDAGVRNDPVNPDTERERMLTHLIFAPVLKSADRVLTISYTINVIVARSTTTT